MLTSQPFAKQRGRELTAAPSVSCYSYPLPDSTRDGGGGLDAVAVRLSLDCVHHEWTASLTTARGFDDAQLGDFEMDFDTDNNLSNGCNGIDWAFYVGYDPYTDALVSGSAQFGPGSSCTSPDTFGISVTHTPGSSTVSMTWLDWGSSNAPSTRPQRFRGVAWLTGAQEPGESDWDRIPNSSMLVAERSTTTAFARQSGVSVDKSYTQMLGGDFNGDGYADIMFYGAGGAPDYVWFGKAGGGFTSKSIAIWGTYTLVAGDFDGDGVSDVLLYAPGDAPDAIWYGSHSGTFTSDPVTINGSYRIASGDFDGDRHGDLLFYAPGQAADFLWYGRADRTFTSSAAPALNNTYRIVAGDFNGDGTSDVLLYAPGGAPDHVMEGHADRTFSFTNLAIDGSYAIVVAGDFDGDGAGDVLFVNPGIGADAIYRGVSASPDLAPGSRIVVDEDYTTAVSGDYDRDGTDDVDLIASGPVPEALWSGLGRASISLPFGTFGSVAVDPVDGRIFVTSGIGGSRMVVLDHHGALEHTINALDGPVGVAFGPTTVYVALDGDHGIATFDRSTLAPLGTIDTGAARTRVTSVSYQNGKLWFTYAGAPGAGGVAVWNPADSSVSTVSTDINYYPQFAKGTAGTDMLVVYGNGYPVVIDRFDISSGTAVEVVHHTGYANSPGSDCMDMVVSPDLARLWTGCGSGYINELDTQGLLLTGHHYDARSDAAVATTSLNGGWVVGGGDTVYADHIGSHISLRNYNTGSVLFMQGVALSADGRKVYAIGHVVNGREGNPTLLNVFALP